MQSQTIQRFPRWILHLAVLLALLGLTVGTSALNAGKVAAESQMGNSKRVLQVALETHPKFSQYHDIDSSAFGYGKNACGLVAAAAAVGGKNWLTLVDVIGNAAGTTYGRNTGIQPSNYVTALQKVFGADNVNVQNASTLEELYRQLEAGNLVIVDIKVSERYQMPSTATPNFAHFARVLGMDKNKRQIYLENTLRGAPYWTVSFERFLAAWERPETTASQIPDPQRAENVTRWAVFLNGALRDNSIAANN